MSTSKPTAQSTTSIPSPKKPAVQRGNQVFLFDKSNYMWILAGLALILIGIALTAGGKSTDPHKFNADELYSFTRITLAPILIMIGFGVEVYAIMKKPAETTEQA